MSVVNSGGKGIPGREVRKQEPWFVQEFYKGNG